MLHARAKLPGGPDDIRPGHDDRARAAVIAHGQLAPVRLQRRFSRAQNGGRVGRVLEGGEEVDEVSDVDGHVQAHAGSGHERSQNVCRVTDQSVLDLCSQCAPTLTALAHEVVETWTCEDVIVRECRQVEHAVSEGDPYPPSGLPNREDPVGQVCWAEPRVTGEHAADV